MSTAAPSPFNLEHLKKEAKRLLRACRAGDAQAVGSIQAALSRMRQLSPSAVAATIQLADVHQALAIERGFSSWGDLTRLGDPLARLLVVIRGGHLTTLRRDIATFGGLSESNVLAAASLGHAGALKRHLALDASLATLPRDGWTPLDYVCSSPLARLSPRHATSLCDCAELLLAAGADPNTAVDDGRIPGSRPPAIMRALLSGNVALVAVLGKRGAEEVQEAMREWMSARMNTEDATLRRAFGDYFRRPDVHEQFKKGLEDFKARGSHAPFPTGPREMQQLMGMPHLADARAGIWSTLIDGGYDPAQVGPTGRSSLHSLATYAQASVMEIFLARGVDFRVRDAAGRSVLATAVRAGNNEVAHLLRARGLEDDSTTMDRLIGFCVADDAEAAQALVADHPEVLNAIVRADADDFVAAAARGQMGQVRLMLACGFPPDIKNEAGATALHQAAWRGQVPVVELLLAFGAAATVLDDLYGESPREWALHAASHAAGAQGPYLEAARLLSSSPSR
jgi:ankyrin repeat protein